MVIDDRNNKGFKLDDACTPEQVERDKYRCEVMMKR
jgi:hypothetical protein